MNLTKNSKNIASLIHLSTFSRFIIPLGNFIGPIFLWITNKDKSTFIDTHGKQVINFQVSILLYTIILGTLTAPFFIFKLLKESIFSNGFNFHLDFNIENASSLLYLGGFIGLLACLAFIIELILIVVASLKARDGELYKYPLTIQFLK